MASKRKASDPPPRNSSSAVAVAVADSSELSETRDRRFRELYSKPPDFKQLARCDPEFAAMTKGRELDFGDPASVVQLTKTLLKLDFGLVMQLPQDRLCPPIPNRHNYILWLKGLLDTSSYSPPGRSLVGIDIGTGASCIYPLLACVQRPWSFVATDIDVESLKWATRNVELNGLGHRIKVVGRRAEDALIPLDDLGLDSVDFTMTNPPFYESEHAMLQSAKRKSRPPCTACTGSLTEMVVEGGEVAFVNRILDESVVLRRRVQWYTSMLGFLSSVTTLVGRLREHGIRNYAVTEFVQGNKTRRWAVAWSFGPMRPAQDVARGTKAASCKLDLLPAATEAEVAKFPMPVSIGELADKLSGAIGVLDLMSWDWDAQALAGTGRAPDKVWARAWRRRKKREAENAMGEGHNPSEPICALGFHVRIHVALQHVSVKCRWLEGSDPIAFESFQGFLQAAARSAVSGTHSNPRLPGR
ncbi:U6 small nuclear RNA (adenine-(43)-N(6))-methyltransferase [Hirsutella rhossiliensis]|uniref:U6 small nuclear RNA (Adenine-(43)-N(6))-methyltransferase n=1 Tax=Hirsutella rhossiliensis TaxID=111463 RepID=A0A9P8MQG6_9HYPO|nr:U6 small nuclear RNA (adenine-(43)-N(6))-methyltransferase [Hirsutella rhossiliensis]KAH0959888.1 U6 small nuclear RNA (adenine-(43)-N(6))-methyltransferase [Hirsutella rhossiliensis]